MFEGEKLVRLPICIFLLEREQPEENGTHSWVRMFGQCGDHTGTSVCPAAGSGPVGAGRSLVFWDSVGTGAAGPGSGQVSAGRAGCFVHHCSRNTAALRMWLLRLSS